MKMVDILLTILAAYVVITVFAYTYFIGPVTSDQSSHHTSSWCDCNTLLTAHSVAHTPQSLRGAVGNEGTKNTTVLIPVAAVLEEKKIPKKVFKLGPTFLLILIPVLPSSSKGRVLIRETWYRGFRDNDDVMLRFMMGMNSLDQSEIRELREENSTHGDIVLLYDITEDVRALTNKTISLIKWATDNVEFTYMMKCDDDTYVYVDNVISELKKRLTSTRLYYGVMAIDTKPILDPDNKWRDTTWNLSAVYLPYARGGGYILSADLVLLLAKHSHHLKWHLNEDVSVGSWLAAFDYERRDDDLFCYVSYGQDLHPCRHDYRLAHLFHGQSKVKLKHLFYQLYKQQYKSRLKT